MSVVSIRSVLIFAAGLGAGALGMAQTVETAASARDRAPAPTPFTATSAPPAASPAATELGSATSVAAADPLTQLAAQLAAEQAARQQLADEVARLSEELSALRREVMAFAPVGAGGAALADSEQEQPEVADEPAQAMVALGVPAPVAADIKRRIDKVELDRLSLRDRAAREGWLGNEKYFEELRKVDGDIESLRTELGDDVYDKFLYATGQMNRVRVEGVIDGSPAAVAEIRANDTILAYAGKRIFSWDELREATTAGVKGEAVPVTVLRGGQSMEVLVPRGPLGVKLDVTREKPQ